MRYLVGTEEIWPARREVLRDRTAVAVEPKVFDLIVDLIENTDRVVPKGELVEGTNPADAATDNGPAYSFVNGAHPEHVISVLIVSTRVKNALSR